MVVNLNSHISSFIFLILFFYGLTPKTVAQVKSAEQLKAYGDSITLFLYTLTDYDIDSAKKIANNYLEFSKNIGFHRGVCQAYSCLSNVATNEGMGALSLNYMKLALRALDHTDYEVLKGILNMNVAVVLDNDRQYAEAIKYFQESVSILEQTPNKRRLAGAYSGLATAMSKAKTSFEEVHELVKKSEELSRESADSVTMAGTLMLYSYALLRKDTLIDLALEKLRESDQIMRVTTGHPYSQYAGNYNGIAMALHKKGLYRQALSYIDSALVYVTDTTLLSYHEASLETRMKAYDSLGLYKQSLRTSNKLAAIQSKLFDTRRAKQINSAKIEFETEKKEAEIITLSQQASIQALEIRQKNQAITIGIVAILFAVAIVFFMLKQREAKKQQSQTELEQRFLRSQLNPHFISNALVAVQSFMLKNDAESATLYLTKFSKLMREILENSRREFITVEEEVSMLKNYMDIHQQRLGSFDYTIDLDPTIDTEADSIPPMFIQPFLENAIEHGIAKMDSGGKIELRFTKEGDFIHIAVNDNGGGLVSKSEKDRRSLSTTIIQERMELFNRSLKKKIQLVIDNIRNENGEVSGMKVELKVPFSYI